MNPSKPHYKRMRILSLFAGRQLAIDDVGTEPETVKHYGNVITPITEALLFRYDARLFTLCTSNLDLDGMRMRYDERVYDRIVEMFNKIAYNNGSYRK